MFFFFGCYNEYGAISCCIDQNIFIMIFGVIVVFLSRFWSFLQTDHLVIHANGFLIIEFRNFSGNKVIKYTHSSFSFLLNIFIWEGKSPVKDRDSSLYTFNICLFITLCFPVIRWHPVISKFSFWYYCDIYRKLIVPFHR